MLFTVEMPRVTKLIRSLFRRLQVYTLLLLLHGFSKCINCYLAILIEQEPSSTIGRTVPEAGTRQETEASVHYSVTLAKEGVLITV